MSKLKIGSKTGLYRFDLKEIRTWKPCYDPVKHLPEEWRGTAVDILKRKDIPCADRLWACLRLKLVSEKALRLFSLWCCRQVQHLMKDPRPVAALDAAEQFALGNITEKALQKARSDAYAAYAAATTTVDVCISYVVATTAASAASAAEASALRAAASAYAADAYAAAYAAAAAAYAAATTTADVYVVAATALRAAVAAEAADDAATYAAVNAREKAKEAQIEKLIEVLLAEGKERLAKRK